MDHDRHAVHDDDEGSWNEFAEEISVLTPGTPFSPVFFDRSRSLATTDVVDDDYRENQEILTTSLNGDDGSKVMLSAVQLAFPPAIPPPQESQAVNKEEKNQCNDDARILALSRQSQNSNLRTVHSNAQPVSYRSPEKYPSSRRSRLSTIEYGEENEPGTMEEGRNSRDDGVDFRSGPYGNESGDDYRYRDEDTTDSNNMSYLPSHFQNHATAKSSSLRSSFYGSDGESVRRLKHLHGQEQYHPRSSRTEVESLSNSVHSLDSMPQFASNRSIMSVTSHQCSTRSTALHGEVIGVANIEENAAFKKVASIRRQQMYDGGYHVDRGDYESHRDELDGMQIGGGSPFTFGMRPSGGHSLLSSQGFMYRDQDQYQGANNNGVHFTFGVATEHISNVRNHATKLGQEAKKGALTLMEQAAILAKQIMNKYYRPPLSPRSKELNDLEFLKQIHKQKFDQYKIPNADVDDEDDENFFDFVIVLNSNEAYKYWAELLDFREEYLGSDWGNGIESPRGISTNTDDSSTSGEDGLPGGKNKGNFDQIHGSPESDDCETVSSTPRTELLRRRRPKTPPSTKKTPINRRSFLRSPSRFFDSHRKSHLSQSFQSNLSPYAGTPSMKQPSRMSIFEQMIQSPTMTSGRSRTLSQHSYFSRSNHTSSDRNESGNRFETPVMGRGRRRWGNPTANLRSQSIKASANTPPVRSLSRAALLEGTQVNLASSIQSNGPKNQQKHKSISSILNEETSDSKEEGEENETPDCARNDRAIPQGFVKVNELTRFLDALKKGIVVRWHRPNEKAAFCKVFSTDGGDTIRYKWIDSKEAFVTLEEQRLRYSPDTTGSDWSYEGGSSGERFNQKYREKSQRAANIVAVHSAVKNDCRHPGEHGTASLRQSRSRYNSELSFSVVTSAGQRFRRTSSKNLTESWKRGKGSELLFKTFDFEAATSGEYWLIFRGLVLLHRDVADGRFAVDRNGGIAGGARTNPIENDQSGKNSNIENRLAENKFIEPSPVGWLERRIVQLRGANDDYIRGAVLPGAVPPVSDYFLGFKSPGTTIWSRLRLAGLETQRIYSVDTRRVMIKIRCPDYRLTDVAEVLRLRMEKKDGSFEPFRESAAGIFKQRDDHLDVPEMYRGCMASLLRSKDRQMIIDFIIGSRIRDSGAQLARTGNIEKIIEKPQTPRKSDSIYHSWVSYYNVVTDFISQCRNRDSGAELVRNCDIGKAIEARIPLHMPDKLDSLCNSWVFYWREERWVGNETSEASVLEEKKHLSMEEGRSPNREESKDRRPVPNFITRFFVEAFNQPLDAIEDYFGEQVTFYFAWAQHTSAHLLFLAFFGMIVTFCEMSSYNLDHPIRPWWSMAVMIWTFTVLVNWRKRSNALAYRWGSMDHKEQETNRPEFQGEFVRDPKTNEYVVDPITNEYVIKYPRWKRWLKYMISIPISAFFTGLALFLILMVHANRDTQMANYIQSRSNNSTSTSEVQFTFNVTNIGKKQFVGDLEVNRDLLLDPTYWIIMITLPSLLGLCIPILNIILMRVSVMLNDFENYQTDAEYRTHLICKVIFFRFVSQFGTVYYYAFMSIDPENSAKAIENGMIRMATSLAIYTTVAHWWNIILQVYIFMGIQHIRRYLYNQRLQKELSKLERDEEEYFTNERCDDDARKIQLDNRRILLEQAQDDHWLEIMKAPHDSFPEYITSVVQFTFVACFSVILPCIPFLVLINYLLSMRFDAYKVCRGRRRPFSKRTGGIGVWEHLLHIVAVIAVLTNCWLVAITNHEFRMMAEKIGSTLTVFLVVAWEHIMLLIKYLMGTTISKLPKEIRDEIRARQHDFDKKIYEDMRLKTEKTRRLKREKSSVASVMHQTATPDSMSYTGKSLILHENKSIGEPSPSSERPVESPDLTQHASSSIAPQFEAKVLHDSVLELHARNNDSPSRLQTIESFDGSIDESSTANSKPIEIHKSTTPESKCHLQTIDSFDDRSASNRRSSELYQSTIPDGESPFQTISSFDDRSIAESGPGELYEC